MLENIEPKRVFHYFEEISKIPRGSGNTKKISDYCVDFAKAHGLKYYQDEYNNIIIYKDASKGYEDHPGVILQGHLDMVTVKTEDTVIDFTKDPIPLMVNGNEITANGTSLGADDGVGVSISLAILEDDTIPHPALEVLFTTDEETEMVGARTIDVSKLHGKYLINLDSEGDDTVTLGSSGGCRVKGFLKAEKTEPVSATTKKITVSGLLGGHSGNEIDKQRLNANRVLGEFLQTFKEPFNIVSVEGGEKDNAICNYCECVVATNEKIEDYAKSFEDAKRVPTDSGLTVTVENGENTDKAFTVKSSKQFSDALAFIPDGLVAFSKEFPGLPETSSNMGIAKTLEDGFRFQIAVRSAKTSEKEKLVARITDAANKIDFPVTTSGAYPAWEYVKDSVLRDTTLRVYKEMFGKEMKTEIVHAGLECGLFLSRMKGVEAISMGPNVHEIHSVMETLEIDSMARTYNFVKELLKQL